MSQIFFDKGVYSLLKEVQSLHRPEKFRKDLSGHYRDERGRYFHSLTEASSSKDPPGPNDSLTIAQILAKALVSVIDCSRGLSGAMEIVRTIRLGR